MAHIPAKLASADIDPARWRAAWSAVPKLGPTARRLFLDDVPAGAALAELEHERWNAQRRMDGLALDRQPPPGRTRRARLHPSLVPYDALADDVKEYDRAYVRQTQDACGRP